jgi:YHS domain-containing protein
MKINLQSATATVQYEGRTYYFCSQLCKSMFEREPEKYVNNTEPKSE